MIKKEIFNILIKKAVQYNVSKKVAELNKLHGMMDMAEALTGEYIAYGWSVDRNIKYVQIGDESVEFINFNYCENHRPYRVMERSEV